MDQPGVKNLRWRAICCAKGSGHRARTQRDGLVRLVVHHRPAIAMWTCLAGPIALIFGAFLWTPVLLLALPPWVLLTRSLLSIFCSTITVVWTRCSRSFVRQPDRVQHPEYILFRLPMQRWANRGDQRSFSQIGGA